MRTIPAGEFKAKCLALMDEVQAHGEPILITKRGNAVARLMPVGDVPSKPKRPLFGAYRDIVTIVGDIVESEYSDEEWERMNLDEWRHTSESDKG
jgi:prevent-host-death family protein